MLSDRKMTCRISWLAFALVIVLCRTAPAQDRWDEIDRISRAAVGSGNFCGVSISVLGKNTSFVRAYGQADRENKRAVSSEDKFHIASVSKLFTALAVMELCESKVLSLDQEATAWLTELPAADWKGVTIRHLLSHTGGVPDYSESEFKKIAVLALDPNSTWTLERLSGSRPEFIPGAQWRYSNAGFNLLYLDRGTGVGRALRTFSFA